MEGCPTVPIICFRGVRSQVECTGCPASASKPLCFIYGTTISPHLLWPRSQEKPDFPTKGRFCRKQTFYDQNIAGTPFIRKSKISDLRTSFGLLASTVGVWAVFTVRRQFLGYITGDSTEYITNDSTQYLDPPQYYFLPYCDCNLKVLLPFSEWRGCTF